VGHENKNENKVWKAFKSGKSREVCLKIGGWGWMGIYLTIFFVSLSHRILFFSSFKINFVWIIESKHSSNYIIQNLELPRFTKQS